MIFTDTKGETLDAATNSAMIGWFASNSYNIQKWSLKLNDLW